ncbi:hypothetical protein [Butyrivibrio sp. XPD2002]|uniref:hypothetical protein n=1 Tax=Butyrivibrio sp. XPD2002 TaxID=1280665 RepID=UPI0004021C86|nr:hypothetical protein [Butyrivibrio sp. XPD2002]
MKKVWNDATLVELDITATAGGMLNNHMVDSDEYYDEKAQTWKVDLGTGKALS